MRGEIDSRDLVDDPVHVGGRIPAGSNGRRDRLAAVQQGHEDTIRHVGGADTTPKRAQRRFHRSRFLQRLLDHVDLVVKRRAVAHKDPGGVEFVRQLPPALVERREIRGNHDTKVREELQLNPVGWG